MAKLPDASALGDRPTPRPAGGLAQYRVDTDSLMEPARALMRGGAELGNEADRLYAQFKIEEEKADNLRVQDAINKLKEQTLDMEFGKDGYRNLQGGAAATRPLGKEYGQRYQDVSAQIESGLSTDKQREKFRTHSAPIGLGLKEGVARWQMEQGNAFADQVYAGAFKTTLATVAANPGNDMLAATEAVRLDNIIKDQVERKGYTGRAAVDAYELARKEANDAIIKSRVSALLYQYPMQADALFRRLEKGINNPELRLQLQAQTREVSQAVTVGQDAQELLATAASPLEKLSDQPGAFPVTYRYERGGKLYTGEAKTEREAYEYMRFGMGNPLTDEEKALAPSTNGQPTARQVAAQLPFALMQVEKKATERYGADRNNPDRAAYVKRLETEIRSQNTHARQMVENQEREALQAVTDAILGSAVPAVPGMTKVGGGNQTTALKLTSMPQLMAIPQAAAAYQNLSPEGKLRVDEMLRINANRAEAGDPALFNELRNDIWDGKIKSENALIMDPRVRSSINTNQMNALRSELNRSPLEGGRSDTAMLKWGTNIAHGIFHAPNQAVQLMGKSALAEGMWSEFAMKKVAEYRAANKDISKLFALDGNPESLLNNATLELFKARAMGGPTTPAAGLSQAAGAVQAGAPPVAGQAAVAPVAMPATITTRADRDAWIATLPPATTSILMPDGKVYPVPVRAPVVAQPAVTPAGKPAEPKLDTPSEPGMPQLVDKPKASRRKIGEDAPTWAEIGGKAQELFARGVDAAMQKGARTGEAAVAGVVAAAEGVQFPSDTAKSVWIFRGLLRQGQYTRAVGPTIQGALDSGDLTLDEARIARRMLQAIDYKAPKEPPMPRAVRGEEPFESRKPLLPLIDEYDNNLPGGGPPRKR